MKFVQAKNYTKVSSRRIDLIVLHTMESPEKPDTAEAVAAWFAGSNAPRASAHYCIDSNSIVQCVWDHDVAWAAPSANHDGLHFEHAGRASQRKADWSDPYSKAELRQSAALAAKKSLQYKIPVVHLSANQVKQGARGFCGHLDVTRAFPKTGTHTDPGVNFPWGVYLQLVKGFRAELLKSRV